jgi:hypothetical protein
MNISQASCLKIKCVTPSANEKSRAYTTAIKPVITDAIQNGIACSKFLLNCLLFSLSYEAFNCALTTAPLFLTMTGRTIGIAKLSIFDCAN